MSYVTTSDNTQLYVKDWGSGTPIILVHGWPLSADSWDDQALAIAEAGHRAISYDRRGFGRSSQPWNGYDYDTLADDLAAVIAQTGVHYPIIAGFSMGGGEVARYLSRHGGDSIAKAVLVSSILPFRLQTPDNPVGTEQSVFDASAAALREDRGEFLTGFFEKFFGAGTLEKPVSKQTLHWAHGLAMQGSIRATLECARAFSSTDFRAEMAAFTMPTLIIHGTEDATVPIAASSRLAAKAIAGSTLIEYEGAPHGLFATDKERLSRDLIQFIEAA